MSRSRCLARWGVLACWTSSLWSTAFAQTSLTGRDAVPDLDFFRVGLALAFCLLLGVAVIFWLKRKMPGRLLPGSSPSVRITETARLGVRASLYVVEFDGRRFLLAADSNGIVAVGESGHAASTAAASAAVSP